MAKRLIKSDAHERFIRMLIDTTADEKQHLLPNQVMQQTGNRFPHVMIVTLILSLLIVIFIIGLAISRYYTYYNRRKNESKDLSYSVSRYWRRQFASTSFDSILSSPPVKTNPSRSIPEGNETARIIKSSFSWPEATIIQQQQQQQQQEKAECSSTISSSSLSNSSTMEEIVGSSSLTFALRYNQITHSLFVRIINARDLFVHHRNRQSSLIDSYVRIELLSTETSASQVSLQSMRTHIIKKNAHPIYDELFEFSHVYPMKNFSLLFTILTYDTFTRDEILGQVEFPIIFPDSHITNALESTETIFTKDIIPRYKQLSNQQLGQMLISLCYQPIDSTITLIVLKASNLPRIGTTRLINPYFKIYMYYKSQRIIKKRSTIKRTTQCPVYNECFTFHIPDNDLQNIHFDIILFDYDPHMKHEPIGTFSIGNDNNQHWIDVCHRQITKQIAQWYQLKPFHKLNS